MFRHKHTLDQFLEHDIIDS